jgi:hypothetical protein
LIYGGSSGASESQYSLALGTKHRSPELEQAFAQLIYTDDQSLGSGEEGI